MNIKKWIMIGAACIAGACIFLGCQSVNGTRTDNDETITKENRTEKEEKAMEPKPTKVIDLKDEDSAVTIKLGEAVRYEGIVHGSVGLSYDIDYDKSAFLLQCEQLYHNPESMARNECGGDEATEICTLKALKKGEYTITVTYDFRGDVERTVTYQVTVD